MANFVNNNSVVPDMERLTMGIDQSFSHTGICITDKDKVIVYASGIATKNNCSLEERITNIVNEVLSVCKEFNVKQVVIEGLSFASMQSSARQLAGLFYVLIYELRKNKITYEVVPPNSLKFRVSGSGKATKQEMNDCLSDCERLTLANLSNLKHTSKKFEDIVDSYFLSVYNKI